VDPSISAATPPPTQSARYLRILLVESNLNDALAFRHILERSEVPGDIVVYPEAEQALEHLQSTTPPYDLLVTNYKLPGMSGLELWQAVLDRKLSLPVVMIIDIGTEHLAVEALNAGVADYLIKDPRQGYLHLLPIVLPQVVHKYRRDRTQQQVHSIIGEAFERVERAKQEWEATVDTLPQFICLLDHQERILRANRTLETWQVAKVKEVKGQKIHDLFHPDCLDPTCYMTVTWGQAWQKVSQGETIEFEAEDKKLERYLQVQIRPISSQGQWESKSQDSFAIVVFEDITERKRANEALMKSLQETKMAYEQAKVYAHDLTDEIKDRRRAEVTLREYTAELELRNQELDEFARAVAHDLKNPLGPIIGYSEMIVENHPAMSASQLDTFLQAILHNSHRLKKIVDTLYLLATVRNVEVERLPLDMARIISQAQERLQLLIETQQPEISFPDQWPTALGCVPWVEEIWVNYLSNALKYSGQSPRIELGATSQAEGLIRFWVRDYGPGLEPQAQANLFAAPPQLNRASLTGEDKLGLPIVGYIAEKLGGQAGVESSGQPGQGCLFYFTLPAAPQ
jgi:PAS domain S-box-containing protein